jgi:hypothetical protein
MFFYPFTANRDLLCGHASYVMGPVSGTAYATQQTYGQND